MGVTMDRYEADWKIVERGWQAHVLGQAPNQFRSTQDFLAAIRAKQPDVSDQVST